MNRQFLSNLNGTNTGLLRKFLHDFQGEPRIAWYPSAGRDFRPLLYLHPEYSRLFPAQGREPRPPDLFLFTDHLAYHMDFVDNEIITRGDRTTAYIESIEELPRLTIPLHREITSDIIRPNTNRVYFMHIKIESNRLGSYSSPVVYAITENESFYCYKIAPNNAKISHIVHVVYGSGLGGGRATGAWLINVMQKLNCELFITDGRLYWVSGDEYALAFCPSIPKERTARFTEIRNQKNSWRTLCSGNYNVHDYYDGLNVLDGEVNWYRVTYFEPGEEFHRRSGRWPHWH